MAAGPSSRNGAPFGPRVEGTGRAARLVLDEDEAATIRKAAALLLDDRRELPEVCRTLYALGHLPRKGGYWHTENLRKMLSDPARKGVVI